MNMLRSMALAVVFCVAFSASAELKEQVSGQILGGSPDAPVRIEVFSDFQCPSCREFYLESIRRILTDYSSANKVCVIYYEFPLSAHQYSRDAARYAEAASEFGRQKLLMVYDALFMEQAKWSADGNIEAVVARVLTRPELQELKRIMQSPGVNATIDKGIQVGLQRKIRSTPTYFIISRKKREKVEGYLTYASLRQVLDQMF